MVLSGDKILFITTGGTIEFVPGKSAQVAFGKHKTTYQKEFRKSSIIPSFLQESFPRLQYDFYQLSMLDSKDVNYKHLKEITRLIIEADNSKIIVTHGTDTLAENAQQIKEMLGRVNKAVVFVAAFKPLEEPDSDGKQNLETAINEIGRLSPGVYIPIGKFIYKCSDVGKDFERNELIGTDPC